MAGDARFSAAAIQAAYDVATPDYVAAFADDLERLPLDRAVLDAAVPPSGLVLDLGCGPGAVAAHLRNAGATPIGADLSAAMLAEARHRNPTVPLAQADMRCLPFGPGVFAAVIAFYSLQHVARRELPAVLREIRRVLEPRGLLALATHLGDGDVYLTEFLGHAIAPMGGCLYDADDLLALVKDAGFEIEADDRRGPLAHEADTQRIYLRARRG